MDLLATLEQEFGVTEVNTKHITIHGHKWTLRKLDYGDVDKSNQLIFKSGSEDMQSEDGTMEPAVIGFKTSMGFVALALAAIDDQPTCFTFKVCKPEELGPFDPLSPPKHIRHKTADKVFTFLSGIKRRMGLVTELFEFYTNAIDNDVLENPALDTGDGNATSPLSASLTNPPSSAG